MSATHGGARAGAGRKKLESLNFRSLSTILPTEIADMVTAAAAEKKISVSMMIRNILEEWSKNGK